MATIKLTKTDFIPKCPYCEKELKEIKRTVKYSSGSIAHVIYACSFCKKVLGIGTIKSSLV